MKLLLVEDDAMIGRALLDALRAESYAVNWVRDGATADRALASEAGWVPAVRSALAAAQCRPQ